MNLRLDESDPLYPQRLAELRKFAAEFGHEPKGVFAFKSFQEFNEYKEIFSPYKPARLFSPAQDLESNEK
ncbi:MAG TPA: hypothetical protein VE863_02300 [Pyrinomonadaceae bacterium]|jgi:hypothetical protein|nr:hypothetical protein [Pyrinomonadaceae bacterium]